MLRCVHVCTSVKALHIASRYAARVCFNSVKALHATPRVCVLIRWTHFMLRCARVLSFREHTSCYVVHFCCTSVNTLMLPCTRVLYFGEHTSCYVAHFCCSSGERTSCYIARVCFFGERTSRYAARVCFNAVNTLRVALCIRWTHFMWSKLKRWKKIGGALAKRKTIQKT